jgi:hypothetical protein
MDARLFALAFVLCASLEAAPKKAISLSTSERLDFASGGAIRVTGSTGELNIEGWDRPEVEIQLTRTLYREDSPATRERVTRELQAIRVVSAQPSPGQLVLTTVFPKRKFPASLYAKCEVTLDYRIRVPRDSKLAIQHESGDVTIYDVGGDIDARVQRGDIVAQLPQPGQYQIDARAGLGTVYTDIPGTWHGANLVGQRFAGTGTALARQITLRTRIGGISVLKMSATGGHSGRPPASHWFRTTSGLKSNVGNDTF